MKIRKGHPRARLLAVREDLRHLAHALVAAGPQTFLGARWIPAVLAVIPINYREPAALRLLSLSPHYFFTGRPAALRSEHQRMRESRRRLAELVVRNYSEPSDVVLDFGCGPGYLARAVAGFAREVVAVDISPGALACAEAINPASNVRYVRTGERLPLAADSIDLICSFAVVQHLGEVEFERALQEFARVLKPGGTVLCHVVVDRSDWAPEDAWRRDKSIRGRLKLRYALHCFSRTRGQVCEAIREAGFDEPEVRTIGDFGDVADSDLHEQDVFVFRARTT